MWPVHKNCPRIIASVGGSASAFHVDISVESQVADLVAHTIDTYGRLDGYFNNAADISPRNLGSDTDAVDIPIDIWRHTLDVNLSGFMYGIRHAVPHLISSGGGSIVNTVSEAAFIGEPVRLAYATTKAAITALSRNTASRYGKDNVRSNCVAPGFVMTEGTANMPQPLLEAMVTELPLTRLGQPGDIAAMAAFLLSDDAQWVTGQTFRVNGGNSFN